MAEGKTNRIAAIGGVVALATGVVGLVGGSVGLIEKFGTKKGPARAERLDNAPRLIDGYLSGPALVDLWTDGLLCQGHDAASSSCTVTMALVQRGARTVRSQEAWGARLDEGSAIAAIMAEDAAAKGADVGGYGHDETAEYEITRTGICASNAKMAEGARGAEPFIISADGSDYFDVSEETATAFRAELEEEYAQGAVSGRQCWRFREVEGQPNALLSYTFIDDVKQADDPVAYTVLAKDAPVILRAPEA